MGGHKGGQGGMACPKDVHVCHDGLTMLSRDPNNMCQFPSCPSHVCDCPVLDCTVPDAAIGEKCSSNDQCMQTKGGAFCSTNEAAPSTDKPDVATDKDESEKPGARRREDEPEEEPVEAEEGGMCTNCDQCVDENDAGCQEYCDALKEGEGKVIGSPLDEMTDRSGSVDGPQMAGMSVPPWDHWHPKACTKDLKTCWDHSTVGRD